ncbi:MAG: 30S ribosomal protein S6 [bacterium]|nr:30S ribosomal protein S6 [bacterium]
MTNYEILLIVDPSLDDNAVAEKIGILKKWIEELGGDVKQADDKGIERLAYEMKKSMQGRFIIILFSLDSLKVDMLRKEIRLDEQIWRYNIKKLA